MRRVDITEGIHSVYKALDSSNLKLILETMVSFPKTDKTLISDFLHGVKRYLIEAQTFNAAAREVANILGVDLLESPTIWSNVSIEGKSNIYELYSNVRFAMDYLPKLALLIEQGSLQDIEQKIVNGASKYKDMQILTINIYEAENTFSSPTRIVNTIESVNHFYYACAMLENKSPSTISIVACDSGSDKSFDFLGLAQVMECVERILGQIWDRVFFFREHQFEERLDLVAKSLPIIAQIAKMKEHNEIEPEMAKQLEQNIFEGTNKFIQSGATTKKIENTSHYSPRALLTPVQRLLVSAPEDEAEATEDVIAEASTNSEQPETSKPGKMSFENLSPEEQEAFRQLFEKATSGNSPAKAASDEFRDETADA